ncbi:MAG TPA: twin-arginine translocation signal domain-containing protein, partial [Blastocatellia bacterium]
TEWSRMCRGSYIAQLLAGAWRGSPFNGAAEELDEIASLVATNGAVALAWRRIRYAVDRLGKKRLLEDAATWPADSRRLSRRDVIRKVGLAAAVALPLITTVVSPKAIQAATCSPNGTPCTASAQCCNGCCKNQGGQLLCAGRTGGCI